VASSSFNSHLLGGRGVIASLGDGGSRDLRSASSRLYLRKQTSVGAINTSALCQKQTFRAAERTSLFDHFVGTADCHGWRSERPQLCIVSKVRDTRTNPRGVFSRVSGLRRDKRHSGHFDRAAPVVMSKNPRFHAGQGCRRDQIIAIRAECRFQLVQAVGRVTGGRVRYMVRDDWPIMRASANLRASHARES
jgi:hypothetical protein